MFPNDQKTQPSICFKTSGQDFQTLSQTIGWDFEVSWGNQKLRLVLKTLATCFNYNTWLSYVFFQSNAALFGRTFIWYPFYVNNCWYLQNGEYQIKFEKGWYNVIQKVKTLPVIKDQNAAAAFSISIEHLSKLKSET